MTREEALNFLELSEKASNYQVKQRLQEKLTYFENIIENAPSDFLRKLNARHVVKVRDIQLQFPEWDASKPEISIEFPPDASDMALLHAQEEAGPLTTPVIISSGSKSGIIPEKKLFPDPPGWLVKHTEHKASKTFALSSGTNYIGRKPDASLNPFIAIDEDPFISKVHAVIFVEESDSVNFYLMDDPSSNRGRESRNGTYVNGNENRISGKVKLLENDTIQVGVTKLMLKVNKSSMQEIISEVKKSKFIHTVIIDKP